ncbi:MAG: CBS domain-containing protein [Proteobacteria bacterium]|nr:CBS domain-containing protein [Pseudomonadota bacterium]
MKVEDVMTRNPVTVSAASSVFEAMRLMLDHHVSGLPVVDAGGALVGIVTEGDFMRRVELGTEKKRRRWVEFLTSPGRLAGEYTEAHGLSVRDIMSRDLQTVSPAAPLADAVALMEKHRIKRLPAIANGRLAGIVSRADLMRAFLTRLPVLSGNAITSDTALRERIAAEIEREAWGPSALVHVTVDGGVATLNGVLVDERVRAALRVLAENVVGAGRVRDRLATIEPMTGAVIRASGEHEVA